MKKRVILLALSFSILGILTSCGSDSSSDSKPTPTSTSTFEPIPASASTPTATPTPTPTAEATQQFTRDNQTEIVTDHRNQLLWQDDERAKDIKACWLTDMDYNDCSNYLPQQRRSSCDNSENFYSCDGDNTIYSRYTAYKECQELQLGGYSGWRVPTIRELKTIVDTSRRKAPFINPVFQNASSLQYWSITTHETMFDSAYVIFFGDKEATESYFDKNSEVKIRCVRDL